MNLLVIAYVVVAGVVLVDIALRARHRPGIIPPIIMDGHWPHIITKPLTALFILYGLHLLHFDGWWAAGLTLTLLTVIGVGRKRLLFPNAWWSLPAIKDTVADAYITAVCVVPFYLPLIPALLVFVSGLIGFRWLHKWCLP